MERFNTSGLIAWFIKNPVAANLLMLFIMVAGILSVFSISKEMFPRTYINTIQVTAVYPGAAPVEVERGVIEPIEAALQGMSGIKEMRSEASRDFASISLDVEENKDINEMLARDINERYILCQKINIYLNYIKIKIKLKLELMKQEEGP